MTPSEAFNIITTLAGIAGGAITVWRVIPWFVAILIDRGKLTFENDSLRKQLEGTKAALDAANSAQTGWQHAVEQLNQELSGLRDDLAEIKHKFALGVGYIASVAEYSELHHTGIPAPLPVVPLELRAEVDAARHPHLRAVPNGESNARPPGF